MPDPRKVSLNLYAPGAVLSVFIVLTPLYFVVALPVTSVCKINSLVAQISPDSAFT